MNLIHRATDLDAGSRKICVAIGVFDGVHLGHQQVIRQSVFDARQHEGLALVVTFDRHPNEVVAPKRTPPLIYSLPQKLRVIASFEVEAALLVHFDRAFSEIPAEQFIRDLVRDLGQVYSVCVGSTFTFGHKRRGDVSLLERLGGELGFKVHGLSALALDGERVSSTRIREAIRRGNLDGASQMLGRAYSLSGTVVEGDHLGKQIGFPTANLNVAGLVLPPPGVYAAHADLRGQTFRAAVNIGSRPTLGNSGPSRVEVHLLDFFEDIYGEEVEIAFVDKLREEQKFPSLDALKEQIARDIESARTLF
jgi:riboflavin kinase / FMN adenylyltransferase